MKTKVSDYVNPIINYQFLDENGLSKREYFAALAMQSILNWPNAEDRMESKITDEAVSFADSLISSLNKNKGEVG